jgi:hypothetical protein
VGVKQNSHEVVKESRKEKLKKTIFCVCLTKYFPKCFRGIKKKIIFFKIFVLFLGVGQKKIIIFYPIRPR